MASDPDREFEIRCPIHGFIKLNAWEREIIAQPAFQRLRRIRQLAWTDQVYPGAMHSRFEHSLGVMHVATLLYDSIRRSSKELLKSEGGYKDAGLERHRQLVRLAALLHDVGHGPFSHAGEELLPMSENGSRFVHEEYSAAIVRQNLRDVIENHKHNTANYGLTANEVAALLEGSPEAKQSLFWRDLIDGQMDADRMDYLLRDSHHLGVGYGRFYLDRVIVTACAVPGAKGQAPRLGILEGGWHSAEALVLARYFMFTQVYFHKTRVAYDIHLQKALREILPGGEFPKPKGKDLTKFLQWDDWRVLGLLQKGGGGEHGDRLARRNHFREVYKTPEIASTTDMDQLKVVRDQLDELVVAEQSAAKSWYKTGDPDIQVLSDSAGTQALPLSRYSTVVKNLAKHNQVKLFARPEDAKKSRDIVETVRKKWPNLND